MTSIAFRDVTHRYRRTDVQALTDLSWDLPRGRSVLLGPNGAGKTTLLAIGADALSPMRGSVSLDGVDPSKRGQRARYRAAVAWMPQHIRAVPGLTCREQVAYVGWLKGVSRTVAWDRAIQALALVDLDDRADTTAAHLSGGQLRRLGLAQCLAHDAQVMLLDEPTVGLDPEQRARFREVMLDLPDIPVLVASHQVDDLADTFEKVAVINLGKIVWQGSPTEFLALAPVDSRYPGEDAFRTLLLRS